MSSVGAAVVHDHAYCTVQENEEEIAEFVTDINVVQSSQTLPISPCLSPTYSCDSGIDSFANDLALEFAKEGKDLLNFLLDDEGLPEIDSDEDGRINDEAAMVSSSPAIQPSQRSVKSGKKASTTDLSIAERNKRNAENAKENRRKKKLYICGLEKELRQLRSEKNVLIGKTTRLERSVNQLEEEVDYLKSIIANQSMLSKLLQKVSMTPGISLSTSFCSSREKSQEDSQKKCGKEGAVSTPGSRKRACNSQKAVQETTTNKKSRKSGSAGGICLHVKENKVSLEFCQICSKISED